MGYHVSILRTQNGSIIKIDEQDIISSLSNEPIFAFEGDMLKRNGEFFLQLNEGELWLTNPDEQDLDDMIYIASKLNARVRGDEFETYRSATKTYIHTDDVRKLKEAQLDGDRIQRATKRRSIKIHICIFAFFALLTLIVGYLDR